MEQDTILTRVKKLLNITDTASDTKLQEYINLFCDKVKSVCNRIDFPSELDYLAVEFVKNNYIYYKNKDDFQNEHMQVTSASDNGQSVNFKTVEIVSKNDIDLDKVIEKNKDEISMYAYMRW